MCVSDREELKRFKHRSAPLNKLVCLFSLLTLTDGIVLSQGGFGTAPTLFQLFPPALSLKERARGNITKGEGGVREELKKTKFNIHLVYSLSVKAVEIWYVNFSRSESFCGCWCFTVFLWLEAGVCMFSEAYQCVL